MKFIALAAIFSIITAVGLDAAASTIENPRYRLRIDLDIKNSSLNGVADIILPAPAKLRIPTAVMPESSEFNGKPFEINANKDGVFDLPKQGRLVIKYKIVAPGARESANAGNPGVIEDIAITDKGVSLTGGWHPELSGMAIYELTAILPKGYTAISEAEQVVSTDTAESTEFRFNFPHPTEGITMAAGRYEVKSVKHEGVDIVSYFFPEDAGLADKYIERAKGYIKLYNDMLGPFPYKRFGIVENFLQSGYSMPTYTLLGSEVVKLPFITETSLGHEMLHQYFGNYVYVDMERGNWCEGLTSYLADHLYDEQKGIGASHRKKLLIDYANYVNASNETGLSEFGSRQDRATRSIGYGKAAMVFHMLKSEAGDNAFYEGLRLFIKDNAFKRASWADIREALEKTTGKDYKRFLNQWVNRRGVLKFTVQDSRAILIKGKPAVSFDVIQQGADEYKFRLPVTVIMKNGLEHQAVMEIEDAKKHVEITLSDDPIRLVIDKNYDLMRWLDEDETPAVMSSILGAETKIIASAKSDEINNIMEPLINALKGEGFTIKPESEIKDSDLKEASIILLDANGAVVNRLFGGALPAIDYAGTSDEGFSLTVIPNPINDSGAVAIARTKNREEAASSARRIPHYGRYSHIGFNNGRNTSKTVAPSDDGVVINLSHPVTAVQPHKMTGLNDVIKSIIENPVVYVGEGHTMYEDHKIQLDVIRALKESGAKFAIGMEMFQRPYQKPLDEYIKGNTDEKVFLKDSEYFKRWKFNYHLYREIIDYARANNIHIIALNQKSETIKKISSGGLDALSAEERAEIPPYLDMSDADYKRRLRRIFGEHSNRGAGGRDFENFYLSQIVWDETMAMSVNDYIKANPGNKVVVLAGKGHVEYGSGIPKRLKRLNGLNYGVIVSADGPEIEPGVADFVLFPKQLSAPEPAMLGVTIELRETGLSIKGIAPGGAAAKAGLKEGDIILAIDGVAISAMEDLQLALFDKKPGDEVKIKIKRTKMIFFQSEMEVGVRF